MPAPPGRPQWAQHYSDRLLAPPAPQSSIIGPMRKVSAFGLLAFANFATCGLGQSVMGEEGKFSISNLGPLVFVVFAAPCFLADVKTIRKQTVAFFLLFNVCALVSFAFFMVRFGW